MIKLNTVIRILLVLLGTGFFALILYVSILGENHKIDYLVTCFFDDIKHKNYDTVCRILTNNKDGDHVVSTKSCMDNCFVMELAFLTRYELMGQSDYTVMIRRHPFWVPFLSDDTISVSVAFSKKKNNLIEKLFHDMDDTEFIHDFLTVTRNKGAWEIKALNLDGSALSPLFTTLSKQVDFSRYIQPEARGFILKENTIIPNNLSDLDRRLLDYSLYKLRLEHME